MMMRLLLCLLLVMLPAPAFAQADLTTSDGPGGIRVPAFVPFCRTGKDLEVVPCGSLASPLSVIGSPFTRATRSPFVLPATTTPRQFLITQPAGATSYLGFNPCANADVRIMSVATKAPIATQPTAYPGVLEVTSLTEVIDRLSGMRFARGASPLGSASNPLGGPNRIVSLMIVPIPGYPADLAGVTCEFELMYGNGS